MECEEQNIEENNCEINFESSNENNEEEKIYFHEDEDRRAYRHYTSKNP